MKSLPWVQLRSMHRRHPGLPSLPAVVDASSSKKSLRCSNSMRLPIHSGTEIRISWDAKSSFASLSSIHGMIMGIQWYTNMKFSWLHSALSKYPRGSLFVRRERLKKSVTWQRQPMGGDGETNVLHTQTPWEVFKHQRLVKKRMQHNAAETHISHTKQVSNNVSMYHHYRCYKCDIMIASHLKHQRHVDVEKTPLSRQPLIWQCLTFNLVPKVPVICPPDNKISQFLVWLSRCHIFED